MNEILAQPGQADLLGHVPYPVLLNCWKHHAGALRRQIAEHAQRGQTGLEDLAKQLLVIGTELMDLYTGQLAPAEIAERVLAVLKADNRLSLDAFRAWILAGGGYQVHTFPEDDSRWVLRLGEEAGRYVHVHPGRWSPATLRVRANVLKSAVMVVACTAASGGDPTDVALVNDVRKRYLGLSPIRGFSGDQGLRGVIDILRAG